MPYSKVKSSKERRQLTAAKKELKKHLQQLRQDSCTDDSSRNQQGSANPPSKCHLIAAAARQACIDVAKEHSIPWTGDDPLTDRIKRVTANIDKRKHDPEDDDATMAIVPESQEIDENLEDINVPPVSDGLPNDDRTVKDDTTDLFEDTVHQQEAHGSSDTGAGPSWRVDGDVSIENSSSRSSRRRNKRLAFDPTVDGQSLDSLAYERLPNDTSSDSSDQEPSTHESPIDDSVTSDTDFEDDPLPRERMQADVSFDEDAIDPEPEPDPDPDEPSGDDDTDEEGDDDEWEDMVDDPQMPVEDQDDLIEQFAHVFSAVRAKTLATHKVAEMFYEFIKDNRRLIGSIVRFPKVYKTLRRRSDKKLPPIFMTFLIRDLNTNAEFEIGGHSFDEKNYGDPMAYRVVESWARIDLDDALYLMDKWHNRRTPMGERPWYDRTQDPVEIDLSWDGISMDKKVDQVLESMAVKRTDCNRVVSLGETFVNHSLCIY